MTTSPTPKWLGAAYRICTVAALAMIAAVYFAPVWWVALTAPNYPPETFPDGVRIVFHVDSVRNGCKVRVSQEVEEKEALDCVHEMDTINHFVGMYPIASGGPVERAFSPFLFSMIGVMLVAFAVPGRRVRMLVSAVGFLAVAAWMGTAIYAPNGVAWQGTGYLQALVDAIGRGDDSSATADESMHPIVRQLKESLEKSAGAKVDASVAPGSRTWMVATLKAEFERDQIMAGAARQQWTGSGKQVLGWHYEKSLSRWFNMPEVNGRLATFMTTATDILAGLLIVAMVFLAIAARGARSPFYWLLVLLPMILPIGFLADFSAWLWWYGHTLNEMGAFTLKPFMPTVFGDGKVAQFTTHSYPNYGFGLMIASSLLLALAALLRRKQLRLAGDAAATM